MAENQDKPENESNLKEVSISVESLGKLLKSPGELPLYQVQRSVRIKDELAKRERIKNDDLAQDIQLKKLTLKVLLLFLGVETIVIFLFAFLQATKFLLFQLEEWSFRLLVSATITQIYLMLKVAVQYLFPRK